MSDDRRVRVARRILSRSPAATEALARALGARLGADSVVALVGDLGSGKTAFTRGLAAGLGIDAGVASPTYTLMQAHEGGRLPLYHFDAWMEGREKALFLDGGDEWLNQGGVAVVEWAGRVAEFLPLPHIVIELHHAGPEERVVTLGVAHAGETVGGEGALADAAAALLALLRALPLPDSAVETAVPEFEDTP